MKIALLILTLGIFTAAIAAQGPSLADIARQERARQNSVKSTATFTNETLGTAAAEPEPPPPADKPVDAAAKPAAPTAPAADLSGTGSVRDETWWRSAFKTARDDVKRTEDRQKVLELDLKQLNMDFLTRSDLFNKEGVLGPLLNAKNVELGKAEMEAERARQKVLQLEDELRRSGAPAGWAR